MSEPAFFDTSVFVYATGREDPRRDAARAVLEALIARPEIGWTSAEVLQEIFHVLLRRGQTGRARQISRTIVSALGARTVALEAADVLWCLDNPLPERLEARDRIHVAVMVRLGITNLVSADGVFDAVPAITRLDPANFDSWRDTIFGE